MILIDGTYFAGQLSLPNIKTTGGGDATGVELALQTVGEKNLSVFVDKYVMDYLIRLFGRELAVTFLEEIDKPSPAQIWIDLRDQLLTEYGSYKASPLANYAYYWIMLDAFTKTTQAGEVSPDSDYAEKADIRYKLVRVWNEMTEMTLRVHNWFYSNLVNYKDYIGACTGRKVCSLTQSKNRFGI
jgi:hypothetical protein